MVGPAPSSPPLPPLPDDLGKRVEDAIYVSVGMGLLALQRAQVRRRELERLVARVRQDLQAHDDAAGAPGT